MRALLLVALLVAGCAAPEDSADAVDLPPGTGLVRGVVVDTGVVPVPDADIAIPAQGLAARSDAEGRFQITGVAPGLVLLDVGKPGFGNVTHSIEVEAGVDDPVAVNIQLSRLPGTEPRAVPLFLSGHLACGAAVLYTSVGCTTLPLLSSATESTSIWSLDFDVLPDWTQGELRWQSTQALSGRFIWQIVQSEYPDSPQPHIGYMETASSPALAYLDTATIDGYAEWIMDKGIDYRFFGGPHELCPAGVPEQTVNRFGCGVTVDQNVEAFVHHFYNAVPEPGWRFTQHGDPVVDG